VREGIKVVKNELTIFLLDVDGVIVDPRAYRVGISRTIETLGSKAGLKNIEHLLPDDREIAYMEACGIHDVWDITNMVFATVLTSALLNLERRKEPIRLAGEDVEQALALIKMGQPHVNRPDYNKCAEQWSHSSISTHPPDVVLRLLQDEMAANARHDRIAGWMILLRKFLVGTRSAYRSYGTKVFQSIILGSSDFVETYGMESEYKGSSLLRSEDKVMISQGSVIMLQALNKRSDCRVAIYTARPSYPPTDISDKAGYSPEAEIATETAGMAEFPLVGMGTMEWLAARHGDRTEDLTKPNTTQAVSTLFSAVAQRNMSELIEEAYHFDKNEGARSGYVLDQLKSRQIEVYVFEDTTSGIKPMLEVARKLQALGCAITVVPLGVASDEKKKEALSNLCHGVFGDVNAALGFALHEIGYDKVSSVG